MTKFPFKVVCIDDHAYLGVTENDDGSLTLGAPDPDERLISLTIGKAYDVIAEEMGMYRLVDDFGEDYLFPPDRFRVLPL